MNATAREEILQRIRDAQRIADIAVEEIPRDYDAGIEATEEQRIEMLTDRLLDYRAVVRRAGPDTVGQEVVAALGELGARRVGVPPGLPEPWLRGFDGEVVTDSAGLTTAELATLDVIVTSSAVTCASTGTIMLDGEADQGRRALTLVPDAHVCVVAADDIVVDVPAAIRRLVPHRPITMISGPSATSDIELQRVEGVHGPRQLVVVIVAGLAG